MRRYYQGTAECVGSASTPWLEAGKVMDSVPFVRSRTGSADGLVNGRPNVYQSLLAKPGPGGQSGLPLTREDLYRIKGEDW
jgi:hypothetical protein